MSLDTYQRVLGMTIASLPFWLILMTYGLVTVSSPSSQQIIQSIIVALSSDVIATVLFFTATEITHGSMQSPAAVEATQSGEIVFAILGEVWILHGNYHQTWFIME